MISEAKINKKYNDVLGALKTVLDTKHSVSFRKEMIVRQHQKAKVRRNDSKQFNHLFDCIDTVVKSFESEHPMSIEGACQFLCNKIPNIKPTKGRF